MDITICSPEYTFFSPAVLVYNMWYWLHQGCLISVYSNDDMPLLNSSIWQDFHMTWVYQGHIPEGAIMSCFSNCFGKDASPPKHTIDIDEGKCPNML